MWNRFKPPKTVLFVQWASPTCRYMVVDTGSSRPVVVAADSLELAPGAPPAEQLQQHLAKLNIRCRNVVLLLPRSHMDVSDLTLPPATEAEISQLVGNAIALELEDNTTPRTTDFLVTSQTDNNTSVLAFSVETSFVEKLTESFKSVQMDLLGITFGGLGSAQLLAQLVPPPASTALIISISDYDIEFSVLVNQQAILFRSLPAPDPHVPIQPQRLTAEIRRTLAVAHVATDVPVQIYLAGDMSDQKKLAQSLSQSLAAEVSIINPLELVVLQADIDQSCRYANLIGIASAHQASQLPVDMVHPRQPPRARSRWRQLAFAGATVAAFLLAAGYLSISHQRQAEESITDQKAKLTQLIKRANKALNVQDSVLDVKQWRQDDITWLNELQRLSMSLPAPDKALIRKITMSSDNRGNGLIDLAVQVRSPEVISELEAAIRAHKHSVSSKRVSGGDEKQQLPWTFDTRVTFKAPTVPLDSPKQSESPGTVPGATGGQADE